ncbi:hypothetical protein [Arthrobacter sp. Y-9]|uniref:hypothetical protein n=1 Tax=Arthrobacter sp. Y-9 TaxID=3039385 RepID=UPI00241C59AD|nr:hypothetical protein [Arthrobacter sp. Y-9]WFR84117.1 hypothetical protein P9849_00250 [Arthrobacter sp. Y-9]
MSRHQEALPTRSLVAADAVLAVLRAGIAGCAVALGILLLTMLVASLTVRGSGMDSRALGIVAVSSIGIAALILLYGVALVPERLAKGRFYAGLNPRDPGFPGAVAVRGQVSDPYLPAVWSAVGLGSLAVLALIPCVVLAAGEAGRLDNPDHSAAFTGWAVASGVLLAVVALCTVACFVLAARNRRWAQEMAPALPKSALGDRGPAVRITTKEQRRRARRAWTAHDWFQQAGGSLTMIGAVLVFAGVYLHQPGLYADKISFEEPVEQVIGGIALAGGLIVAVGLVLGAVTGGLDLARAFGAIRTAAPESASPRQRRIARTATAHVLDAGDAALRLWTVGAVLAGGWVLGGGELSGAAVLAVLWAALGVALVWMRVVLEAKAPWLRNRLGYQLPSEPDDSEYPNLTVYG